jgi:hypothetical protein
MAAGDGRASVVARATGAVNDQAFFRALRLRDTEISAGDGAAIGLTVNAVTVRWSYSFSTWWTINDRRLT